MILTVQLTKRKIFIQLNSFDFFQAFLAIATNPINSLVPLACEVLKKSGHFNPTAVFGITTINTVRANTFVAKTQGLEPESVVVPVIGGHSEETIIPVLSQAKPCAEFTNVSNNFTRGASKKGWMLDY